MKTKTVIKVVHGSHLYNLNHENSDSDYYQVYDYLNHNYRPHRRKQSRQFIVKNLDEMIVSLDRFKDFCYAGVPQALEVLWSPPEKWIKTNDWENISYDIKQRVVTNKPKVLDTYRRTAWNFIKEDSFKKNRHAMRLCLNALEFKNGSFMQIALDQQTVNQITKHANFPYDFRLKVFLNKYFWVFDDVE